MRRITIALVALPATIVPAAYAAATVPPGNSGGVAIVRQQAETAATEYFATAVDGGATHVACETPSADAPGVVFYCFGVNSDGARARRPGDDQRLRQRRDLRRRFGSDGNDGADDHDEPNRRLGPRIRQPGRAGRPDHRADDRCRHPRRCRGVRRATATGWRPCRAAVGLGDRAVVRSLPRRARRDDLGLRRHRRRRLDAHGRAARAAR